MSLYSIFNDMFKVIISMSLIMFMGLFLTTNLYAQNSNEIVTSNVTTIIPQPMVQNPVVPIQQIPVMTNNAPQQSGLPSTGNTLMDALFGGLVTLLPIGYAMYKQRETVQNVSEGLNRSTQVTSQTVESVKGTDYTDEDIMRIFVATLDKLDKVGIVKQVLDEKMKTTPEDLLMNNKSVKEAAENLLGQIIGDNQAYYTNLPASSDDTCDNRYLRNLSRANKMTRKN